MLKKELIYREILYQAIEKKNRKMTQAELARSLKISLSTVNNALKPLIKMNAIDIKKRNFVLIDPKKALYYWASIRKIEKDIIYSTRIEKPILVIESEMPSDVLFTAYTGYKFEFKDVPADYSEIYIYTENIKEIKKRFPFKEGPSNLFVLKRQFDKVTMAQLFVDLWNIKTWYARDFLIALEKKILELIDEFIYNYKQNPMFIKSGIKNT